MKTHPLLLKLVGLFVGCITLSSAQVDSNRFVWKGWQVELASGVNFRNPQLNHYFFEAVMAQDPTRFTSISNFSEGSSAFNMASNFNGLLSAKLFFRAKAESAKTELFIGLRYGESALATVQYNSTRVDTLSAFPDNQMGITKLKLRRTTQNYTMSMWDRRLYLPFGVNRSTSQARLIWLSYGLELCPFVSFAYQLSILGSDDVSEATLTAGSTGVFLPTAFIPKIENTEPLIRGYGTGFYVGVPLAVYVQPFHKTYSFAKHFSFFAGITPLFVNVRTSYSEAQSNLHVIAQTGFRADFR